MPDIRCGASDTKLIQDAFVDSGIQIKHYRRMRYPDSQTTRLAVAVEPTLTSNMLKALELMSSSFNGRFIRAHISNVATRCGTNTVVLVWFYTTSLNLQTLVHPNLVWASFNEGLVANVVKGWKVPKLMTTVDV